MGNANNPLTQKNQDKLEKLAKQQIQDFGKKAQAEASKLGINFDWNQVLKNIQGEYGENVLNEVEQVAEKEGVKAEKAIKGQLNRPEVKRQLKGAKQVTFNDLLGKVATELRDQVKKIPNSSLKAFPGAKKSITKFINQGEKEATKRLNQAKIGDKKIAKEAKKQQVVMKNKLNQAVSKL